MNLGATRVYAFEAKDNDSNKNTTMNKCQFECKFMDLLLVLLDIFSVLIVVFNVKYNCFDFRLKRACFTATILLRAPSWISDRNCWLVN